MASEGGAEDSDHIWEAEEHSRRPYMRFSEGRSQNNQSELPAGYGE
jgi:hypothetical protein